MGVIVKEALANGRLTGRGDVPRLAEEARRRGTTADALALAAALAKPWANVVLSGAATVEQLESNVAALELRYKGGLEDLAEEREAYWSRRSGLPWN
jgi:aryl-alcohol dehydrogenase-like predicted oxidoreductase